MTASISATIEVDLSDEDDDASEAEPAAFLVAYDPRRADARARIAALGWQTLNVRALRKPKDVAELRLRLARNLPLYAPVYVGATCALLVASALCNPVLLASWVMVAVAWCAYGVWGDPSVESRVAGLTASPMEKRLLLLATNLVAFVWGGILTSVAWVVFVGFLGAATHAAGRRVDPSAGPSRRLQEQPARPQGLLDAAAY